MQKTNQKLLSGKISRIYRESAWIVLKPGPLGGIFRIRGKSCFVV
jgi:hypothetical protein